MKNKKILTITTIATLCTTGIAFANEMKILQKNNTDYIPFKQLVKNAGGNINEKDATTNAKIDGKNITIENDSSFAKVNENYYPLNEKELNGFKIPVDTKPLYEGKEMYVSKDFLKENKVVDFKIKDGKIILEDKNKPEDKKPEEKPVENIQNNKEN
ncbi:MAG: stalk domain-containing protein, partial [Clostridia bacterium]